MATKTEKTGENRVVNRIAGVLDTPPTMKPEIVTFTIIGMSPLLQNNPAEFIGKEEKETGLVSKKVYKDEDEAALRVYKDPEGNYVHPAIAFIRGIQKAVVGKKFQTRVGKVSASSLIKGGVFLTQPFCLIETDAGKPAKKYTIDRQPVVIGKARIPRVRPCWWPWRMQLVLEVDIALLHPVNVKDALSLAGRIIGAGDYRPEKGGGFGRYQVE